MSMAAVLACSLLPHHAAANNNQRGEDKLTTALSGGTTAPETTAAASSFLRTNSNNNRPVFAEAGALPLPYIADDATNGVANLNPLAPAPTSSSGSSSSSALPSGTLAPSPANGTALPPTPDPNSGPVIDGHVLPTWTVVGLGIGLIGVGLLETFAGYKFFRTTLFTLGFLAAGLAVFLPVWDHLDSEYSEYIGLGLGGLAGLVVGGAGAVLPRVGVFLVGSALGIVGGMVLNTAFLYKIAVANDISTNVTLGVGAGVLGLVFGVLAIFMMRFVVVIATSVVGAYAVMRGIGSFAGNYPDEFALKDELMKGDTNLPWQTYAYLGGWAALSLLGVFVQFCVTAPRKKGNRKEDRDEWEEQFDVSEISFAEFQRNVKKARAGKLGASSSKKNSGSSNKSSGGGGLFGLGGSKNKKGSSSASSSGGKRRAPDLEDGDDDDGSDDDRGGPENIRRKWAKRLAMQDLPDKSGRGGGSSSGRGGKNSSAAGTGATAAYYDDYTQWNDEETGVFDADRALLAKKGGADKKKSGSSGGFWSSLSSSSADIPSKSGKKSKNSDIPSKSSSSGSKKKGDSSSSKKKSSSSKNGGTLGQPLLEGDQTGEFGYGDEGYEYYGYGYEGGEYDYGYDQSYGAYGGGGEDPTGHNHSTNYGDPSGGADAPWSKKDVTRAVASSSSKSSSKNASSGGSGKKSSSKETGASGGSSGGGKSGGSSSGKKKSSKSDKSKMLDW